MRTIKRIFQLHSISFAIGLIASVMLSSRTSAQPRLSAPVMLTNHFLQFNLSNCGDTNLIYAVTESSDFVNWNPIYLMGSSATDIPVTVPAGKTINLYKVVGVPAANYMPAFPIAVAVSSNFDASGTHVLIDSFDSSNPLYSTAGQYDSTKRKADGGVATSSSLMNAVVVGDATIYGAVYTGPGSQQQWVGVAGVGCVGDLNYVNAGTHSGTIEAGHWIPNFNGIYPSVPAPDTTGWSTVLPSPGTNGVATLAGGHYVTTNLPTPTLVMTSTVVWIPNSCSLSDVTVVGNARLTIFVGPTNGTGATLSLRGPSNFPGYASNVQIYGLPSLTGVTYTGVTNFVGTIYAPQAAVTLSGGGNSQAFFTGAIVAKAVSMIGNANLHFDESLLNTGPGVLITGSGMQGRWLFWGND